MRFRLSLHTANHQLLPFNYQYPLSAAIYKVIQKADAGFAAFLHNTDYAKAVGNSSCICFRVVRFYLNDKIILVLFLTGEVLHG